MISNKTLTFAAVAFATANGLSVQSKLNAQAQVEADVPFFNSNSIGDALEFEQNWCWRSAQKWYEQDVYDRDGGDIWQNLDYNGDIFQNLDYPFGDRWEYAPVGWMEQDNWEILGETIVSPVFTPDFNCFGGPSHKEMCLTYETQPGEIIPDNRYEHYYNVYEDTYTMDFNYQIE